MFMKPLFIAIAACTLTSTTFAITQPFLDESVLTPGARLVAGDPAKNEFFILDKDDPNPIAVLEQIAKHESEITKALQVAKNKKAQEKKEIAKAVHIVTKHKNLPPRVKVVLKEAMPKKIRPPIKNSAIYAAHKIRKANQKNTLSIKTALRKTSHQLAKKKTPSNIVMLNRAKHKARKVTIAKI